MNSAHPSRPLTQTSPHAWGEGVGTVVPGLSEILRRVLLPFALFAVVLLSLLLLSWFLLLPRFTRVELHGTPQDPSRLQSYSEEVETAIRSREERRLALILPLSDSPYGELVSVKVDASDLFAFFEQIKNVSQSFLPEKKQVVILQTIALKDHVVELTGDVRNVGLQSMAVLAQFVEALRAMPDVERVDYPAFQREQDSAIGFHSPFTIRIHLKS